VYTIIKKPIKAIPDIKLKNNAGLKTPHIKKTMSSKIVSNVLICFFINLVFVVRTGLEPASCVVSLYSLPTFQRTK
jgi:hypothetical protein